MSDKEMTLEIDSPENGPRYLTRFIGQDGEVLAAVAGLTPSYRFTGSEIYVRASIIGSNDKRAWSQPVFRDKRDVE
ncbi:hypothetical protein [Hyphococcus sp. DH-69]|uniref:hypothetical protein n=1 Tax=Hyphococcus formosus TaxID=3143534 RepID=UPI00398ABAB7